MNFEQLKGDIIVSIVGAVIGYLLVTGFLTYAG